MGRGLLFQHQLPWRGRFSRQAPKHSPTYAVLAILSDSYPPLKGRLPTCYSPVRHFTRGRSPFLVRLACVRPAANVRSEPGSNSPVNLKSSTSAQNSLLKTIPRDPNSVFSSRFSFQRPTRRNPGDRSGRLHLTTSLFGVAGFLPATSPIVKLFFRQEFRSCFDDESDVGPFEAPVIYNKRPGGQGEKSPSAVFNSVS
jgi:hypothetical protein